MEQKLTIEKLLKSMLTLKPEGGVSDNKRQLENSVENWRRIGKGDKFRDIFDSDSEAEEAIKEFIANNPYLAI
jgi:hypothetical protein